MSKVSKEVNEYYQNKLEQFGPGAQGVGWKNEEVQVKRFEQLCRIIDTPASFSINDLGCGTGELYSYLKNSFASFNYHGYDQLESMINISKNKWNTAGNATFSQIADASEMEPADYTVASGIFSLRYNTPEKEWVEHLDHVLNEMNRKSAKGFAFNMLTSYSDKEYMEEHLYYADPLPLFDYCKRNFSRNIALLHDYNEYDFTILVRK